MNQIRLNSQSLRRHSISGCRVLESRKQRSGLVQRSGLTMTEIIVSVVLLATVMSLVGTLCFRVNLIWSDVDHHRVAVNELSNHMEVLTLMKPEQATTAIKSLKPSQFCSRVLKSPVLSGEILEDELGSRVVLRLDWNRPTKSLPTELSGWIIAAPNSPTEKTESEGEQ